MVVAAVTFDVVVQRVTGTVQVLHTLQNQVFNVIGQGVVDNGTNSIDTGVCIAVLDNLVVGIVNEVNVVTVATAHDVSTGTTVQVVVAGTTLQVVFTFFTVQRVTVGITVNGVITSTGVDYVCTIATVDDVFASSTINGIFSISTADNVAVFAVFSSNDITWVFIFVTV